MLTIIQNICQGGCLWLSAIVQKPSKPFQDEAGLPFETIPKTLPWGGKHTAHSLHLRDDGEQVTRRRGHSPRKGRRARGGLGGSQAEGRQVELTEPAQGVLAPPRALAPLRSSREQLPPCRLSEHPFLPCSGLSLMGLHSAPSWRGSCGCLANRGK